MGHARVTHARHDGLMKRSSQFIAVAALVVSGAITAAPSLRADSANEDARPVLQLITPCRLADTRPGLEPIGSRTGAIGGAETVVIAAMDGQCTERLPTDAVGLSLNVTALGASDVSFVTIWDQGELPLAASLNPAPGQPATPNAVTVGLADDGSFRVYNHTGSVHLVIDVVGFYVDHDHDERYYSRADVDALVATIEAAGTPGPAGPSGPSGATGPSGPVGVAGADGADGSDLFERVRVVSAELSDVDNGNALLAAVAEVDTLSGFGERWLILLEPGVYDVGSTEVDVSNGASLVGMVQNETVITGSATDLVSLGHAGEIRDLTLSSSYAGTSSVSSILELGSGADGAAVRNVTLLNTVLTGANRPASAIELDADKVTLDAVTIDGALVGVDAGSGGGNSFVVNSSISSEQHAVSTGSFNLEIRNTYMKSITDEVIEVTSGARLEVFSSEFRGLQGPAFATGFPSPGGSDSVDVFHSHVDANGSSTAGSATASCQAISSPSSFSSDTCV